MANPLSIKITANIDRKKTIAEINSQIADLSKNLKSLNIGINLDNSTLSQINKQITDLQKKIKNSGSTINPIDSAETKKSIQAIEGEMRASMNRIAKSLKNSSNRVSFKELYDIDGEKERLKGFVATVNDLQGKVQKLTFIPSGGDGQLMQVGKTITDNTDKVNASISKAKANIISSLNEITHNGRLSAEQIKKLFKDVDASTTTGELDKVKQNIRQLSSEAKIADEETRSQNQLWNKLAESQRKAAEESAKWEQRQQSAIEKTRLQNDALREQIANWQRQATVQANNLGYRFEDFSKLDPSYSNRLTEIKRSISELNNVPLDQARQRMNDIRLSMRELSSEAEIAGGRVQTLGDDFRRATSAIALWTVSGGIIFGLIDGFQSLVQTLIDVDTQMTELERVMDAPQETYNQMLQDSVDLSNTLSVKLNDILTITNEFARQGFSSDQTMQLTKTAALLENISDITPEDSMNALTAAMKAFNIPASEAITIADKLNKTDNEFSINTVQLAQGLFRAASTASTYGVSLDQLLGQITAVGEVTRESGNIIGTFLKTLYSRLMTSPNSVTALDSIGISVKSANGEMKTATEVLNELSGRWNSLSDAQRQSLGVTIAGREQLSRFFALMQNYQSGVDATTSSLDSQGSAMEENIKYQDSLQARLNRLQNIWSEFSLAVGDAVVSDSLIAGLSLLTKFGQAASTVVEHVGTLPVLFGLGSAALVVFNKNIRQAVIQGTLLQGTFRGLLVGMDKLTAVSNKLRVSWRGLLASTGIGVGLVALGFIFEKLIDYYGKQNAELEKNRQEIEKQTSAYESHKKEIDSLANRYETLSKQVENGTISPNNKEYLDVQNKLNKLLPSLTDNVDKNGQAHLRSADAVGKEIDQLNQLSNAKAYSFVKNFGDSLDEVNKKIDDAREKLKESQDMTPDPIMVNGIPHFPAAKDPNDLENVAVQITAEKEYQTQLQNRIDLFKQFADAYAKTQGYSSALTEEDNKYIDSLVVQNKNMMKTEEGMDKLKQKIKDTVVALGLIRQAFGDSVSTEFISNLSEKQFIGLEKLAQKFLDGKIKTDDLKSALDALGFSGSAIKTIIDGLSKSQDDNAKKTKKQKEAVVDLTTAFQDAAKYAETLASVLFPGMYNSDELNRAANAFMVLSELQKQLGAGAKLSSQQQQALNQSYDRLAQEFPQYVNGHNINIDAIQREIKSVGILEDATKRAADGQLSSEQAKTLAVATGTRNRLNSLKEELAGYEIATKMLAEMHKTYAQFNQEETVGMERPGAGMTAEEYEQYQKAVDKYLALKKSYGSVDKAKKAIAELEDQLSSQTSSLDESFQATDKADKGLQKYTQTITRYKYIHDKLSESLDRVNSQLQRMQDITSRYAQGSSGYRRSIQQEIDLLRQKGNLLKAQERSIANQIRSGNIAQYGIQSTTTQNTTYSTSSGSNLNPKNYGKNVNKWVPVIEQAAAEMGVGLTNSMLNTILARIKQESGGSETVVNNWDSNARAGHPSKGLLQFIQPTFNRYKVNGHGNLLSGYDQLLAMFNNTNWYRDISRSGGWGPTGSKRKSSVSGSSSITIGQSEAERQQALVQARQQQLALQEQIIANENAIHEAYMNIVNSHIQQYENRAKLLDDDLAKYKYQADTADKMSKQYVNALKSQIGILNQQKKIKEEQFRYTLNQYKTNKNLTEAQKDELLWTYNEQKTAIYDLMGEIDSINEQIRESYQTLADNVIQGYKDFYQQMIDAAQEAHDRKVELIDDEQKKFEDSINKQIEAIDRQEDANDYNKELKDRQKAIQDLQNQINNFSMDDSAEGRSRVTDLRQQLEEAQADLDEFMHDQSIEARKQKLQDSADAYQQNADAQREEADKELENYQDQINNIINDNRKWTKMESEILKGHYGNILKDFQNFSKVFQKESDLIGKSIANNMVDKIKDLSNQIKGLGLSGNGSNTRGYNTTGANIPQFAEGGYTGNWSGNSAMLALLHPKETIFNEEQMKSLGKSFGNMFDRIGSVFNFTNNVPKLSPANANGSSKEPRVIQFGDVHITGVQNGEEAAKVFFTKIGRGLQQRGDQG